MITIITTTIYSRDLGFKEMMMMESMMNLPDDMFRMELLPYLTVHDIVKLDNACMNHKYRYQLMEKISGVILPGDKDESIKASLFKFKWLAMRRIYLINMMILVSGFYSTVSDLEKDYVDQFRYTRHVVMRGPIRDDMAIFIISHCLCLLSIDISQTDYRVSSFPRVTDHTLQLIAEHCTGLQSLSLNYCTGITDSALITISEQCPNLQSLDLSFCRQITDASIISISSHCYGLQSLNLQGCRQTTDASIISISSHCTGLLSLHLDGCDQITDASIISISTHCTGLYLFNLGSCKQITGASIISISTQCTGLQSLDLKYCEQITDASIKLISTHCIGLQSLNLEGCEQITDTSIIPISENCTGLKSFDVSWTNITDASLIAIAKNCTGLQNLRTHGCNGLSNRKLCRNFNSVSDLRATLLSIYPSLPI